MFKKTNLFTLITQALIIILPFYVLVALYLQNIVGIPRAWFFLKEWLLVVLLWSLIYHFIQAKKIPKFEWLDYAIIAFIIYGIWITLVEGLWFKSIAYGWRYDFMFFIVFLIYRHGKQFLLVSLTDLLKLFMYSGGISLFIGFIIKFRLWEDTLTAFGYVMYQGNWIFEGWVPAYHGLEWSGIRRFQWIFDSPSAMGYFLILFSGIFLYLQKKKLDFFVILMGIFFFVLFLLTYSRSALLWIFTAWGFVFLLNIKTVFSYCKKYFLWIVILIIAGGAIIGITFQDKIQNVIMRTSSTNAHFERMEIWYKRFLEKPLWAWLAESGPGFRSIYPNKTTKKDEEYYIPESWFIQVLIEWGVIYFILFVFILGNILWRLEKKSHVIMWLFLAIIVMNIFLHIFEATYLSILTFLFTWLFINKK